MKLSSQPFALIGINLIGHPPGDLKAVMEKEDLNWRSIDDDGAQMELACDPCFLCPGRPGRDSPQVDRTSWRTRDRRGTGNLNSKDQRITVMPHRNAARRQRLNAAQRTPSRPAAPKLQPGSG